jgi:hypothetical protein
MATRATADPAVQSVNAILASGSHDSICSGPAEQPQLADPSLTLHLSRFPADWPLLTSGKAGVTNALGSS